MNADERTKMSMELERNLKGLLEHLGSFLPSEGACLSSRDGSLAVELFAWRRGKSTLCDLEVRLLPRALASEIPEAEVEEWRKFYQQESASSMASSREAAIRSLETLRLPRISPSDLAGIQLLLTQDKQSPTTPERRRADMALSRSSGNRGHRTPSNLQSASEPWVAPRRLSIRSAVLDARGRGTFRSVVLEVPVRVNVGGLCWLPLGSPHGSPSETRLAVMRRPETPGPEPIRGRGVRPANMPQETEGLAEAIAPAPGAIEFAARGLGPMAGPTEFVCEEVQEGFTARVERLSADGTFRLAFSLFAVPAEAKFTSAHLIATYRDSDDIPVAEAEAELLAPTPDREHWGVTTPLRLLAEPQNPADVKRLLKTSRPLFVIEPWK